MFHYHIERRGMRSYVRKTYSYHIRMHPINYRMRSSWERIFLHFDERFLFRFFKRAFFTGLGQLGVGHGGSAPPLMPQSTLTYPISTDYAYGTPGGFYPGSQQASSTDASNHRGPSASTLGQLGVGHGGSAPPLMPQSTLTHPMSTDHAYGTPTQVQQNGA